MKKKRKQRILAALLGFALFFTLLPVGMLSARGAERPGNLVKNGNFEKGLDDWDSWFNDNSASAEVTQDFETDIHIHYFLNFYNESGIDCGPVDWTTQIGQKNIAVERGKSYKLRFRARATVKRPIAVEIKSGSETRKEHFVLGTDNQVYEIEIAPETNQLDLAFFMGQITKQEYGQFPFTKEELELKNQKEEHHVFLSDVRLMDSAVEEEKTCPAIIGVEDGREYNSPVAVRVNYLDGSYKLEVKKDGKKIDYQEGGSIREDGSYEVTAAAQADASICSTVRFTIRLELDYSKKWAVIANKATGKVMEAKDASAGGGLVQSSYAGRAGQFFELEEFGDCVKLSCMAGGYVVDIADSSAADGTKLVLAEDNGKDSQLWKVDRTVPQGYVKFINKASGKAVGVAGASQNEGAALTQSQNTGNADEGQQSIDTQRWDIIYTIDAKEAIEGISTDVSTSEGWAKHALITPVSNGLNPAGPVTVEFHPLSGAKSYEVYFDGKKTISVTQEQLAHASAKEPYLLTKEGTIKLFGAAYSTKVSKHTLYIQTDTGVKTKAVEFYLSKKGVGWGTLHRTEDMNLSWYYRWSTDEALGTDRELEFVPMLWGNYGDGWLEDVSNKKYGTVLSFNEPDWEEQSNVPVTKKSAQEWADKFNQMHGTNVTPPASVEEAWQAFMDSGLRIGSPATAVAPPYCKEPGGWWYEFMELMEQKENWDYDFTAVHCYDGGCDAEGFLKMIDDTYAMNKKPIWVTEFGVAEWAGKQWGGGNAQAKQKVLAFMEKVVNGLEERDFVERYAWFPFSPEDEYGGASGIFDYDTGKLTELGKLYQSLGVPEGYDPDKKGQDSDSSSGGAGSSGDSGGSIDGGTGSPGNSGSTDGSTDSSGNSGGSTNGGTGSSGNSGNTNGGTDSSGNSGNTNGSAGSSGSTTDTEQLLEAYLKYADSLKQERYTKESWAEVSKAVREAKNNISKTQEELKQTVANLEKALALLQQATRAGKVIHVEKITLAQSSIVMKKGERTVLQAAIEPLNATDQHMVWASSCTDTVFVGAGGVVTAVDKGTAKVTVVTADGQKKAVCTVTVK